MKNKLFLLTLFTAALCFAQSPEIERDGNYTHVTFEKSFDVKSGAYQLEISDVIADLEIIGSSDNSVKFKEVFRIRTTSKSEAEDLYDKYHLDMKKTEYGHALINKRFKKIRSGSHIKIEYTLEIPTKSSIAGKTFSGDITIENTEGQFVLATYGGDIQAENVSGSMQFSTAGGDINVENLEGNLHLYTAGGDISAEDIKGKSEIETAGGDIEIFSHKGNLEASTFGGDIYVKKAQGEKIELKSLGGDIKIRESSAEIILETAGGDISAEDITGSLDGETLGGMIECQNITGHINMETAGGDIIVEELFGSADLETLAGDIEIEKLWSNKLEKHDIRVNTEYGDIMLTIPEKPDFNLKAKAHGFGVEIISDFPLEIIQKDNRKVIGSHTANKGSYSIDLTANEGDISIKKGRE
ncbi:MAG: DUF4097 family beta strand repeat protein [Candidatus Marinimicrobia bacterium]|nr:DUF4097 family beta strand repeat protein [Candidatus Neomarinimicrobiota bacterium]